MLTDEHRASVEACVLCWLATSGADGFPSVSPKETFSHFGDREILIANIASRNSVQNLLATPKVCVSFVHVFRQRGFKVQGTATYLQETDPGYRERLAPLRAIAGDAYPIHGIISVRTEHIEPILAPSYFLFPDETEADKVAAAKRTYGV
ncbi:MAG: pyridoxamine 5'-phosphate oxidase family protein [Bacteroidota bacterium]